MERNRLRRENERWKEEASTRHVATQPQAAPFRAGLPNYTRSYRRKPAPRSGVKALVGPPTRLDFQHEAPLPPVLSPDCGGGVRPRPIVGLAYQENLPVAASRRPRIAHSPSASAGQCTACCRPASRSKPPTPRRCRRALGPQAVALALDPQQTTRQSRSASNRGPCFVTVGGPSHQRVGLVHAVHRCGLPVPPPTPRLCATVLRVVRVRPTKRAVKSGGHNHCVLGLFATRTRRSNPSTGPRPFRKRLHARRRLRGRPPARRVGPLSQFGHAGASTCRAHLLRRCSTMIWTTASSFAPRSSGLLRASIATPIVSEPATLSAHCLAVSNVIPRPSRTVFIDGSRPSRLAVARRCRRTSRDLNTTPSSASSFARRSTPPTCAPSNALAASVHPQDLRRRHRPTEGRQTPQILASILLTSSRARGLEPPPHPRTPPARLPRPASQRASLHCPLNRDLFYLLPSTFYRLPLPSAVAFRLLPSSFCQFSPLLFSTPIGPNCKSHTVRYVCCRQQLFVAA